MKKTYKRTGFDAVKLFLLHQGYKFLIAVVLLAILFLYVIGFSVVSGNSMNNTLKSGELVIFTRIGREDCRRGDIVALRLASGDYYIKRVLAVAGDTVDLRDGVLYINGIAESGDYVVGTTLPENKLVTYPLTVSDGCVFTVGDNREVSVDSRDYGEVGLEQILGVIRLHCGWFYISADF